MKPLIEICVQGVASALAAGAGGADRVELCEGLAVGGVTPIAGAIAVACRSLTIPVHVLIRPRGGDFCYSETELEVMRHDIGVARGLGAAGVVLGLLDREGRLDREGTARLVALARPMAVTFHKAFDDCRDPFDAIEALAALGVERILTSGQSRSALEGIGMFSELSRRAGDRLTILAGGRIEVPQIPTLVRAGLRELHLGSGVCVDGKTDAGRVRLAVETARRVEVPAGSPPTDPEKRS